MEYGSGKEIEVEGGRWKVSVGEGGKIKVANHKSSDDDDDKVEFTCECVGFSRSWKLY